MHLNERYYLCLFLFNAAGDSLVVLGGTTGERLRTAEVYEQRMDRWQPLAAPMIEVI